MKDSKPSLVLFIVAGILALAGKAFGAETLVLLSKPMVVPAIYYYYLQTKTRNVNVLFSIAVWLFFVADMIMLLFPQNGILWIMGCGMGSYIVMLKFALDDSGILKFSVFNILFLSLLLLLLSYILVTILNLNIDSIINNYLVYLVYGIILIMLVVVSTFNCLSDSSLTFLHLCAMAMSMLVSDLFYCINRFIVDLPVIDHINLFCQFLSYFFMVRYFNSRKNRALQRQQNRKLI